MRLVPSIAACLLASLAPAFAQDSLPRPEPLFGGRVGDTWKESVPDYPKPVQAPAGAPNVLVILLDDTGFGHAATFGGAAQTPTLDRLAREGLRYNQFHTTALCSPTRAALLTGRNHHSVGSGVVIEMGTGFPGYTGIAPDAAAGLPEILRANGYATAAFGKWHNTPDAEISPAGPFDRWPTGRTWGFEYFYGFMNGESNQYYPSLYRGTTPVAAPKTPEQGYHLTEDIVDEAIGWLDRVNATNPSKPWFLYFAPGAIHAPHHAPQAYRDKYRGKFDAGWDRYREETFARQKQLGVIPADTVLTPRPAELPAWADQPEEARRVYARLMENYSGYLEHTDVEIGRLIAAIETSGKLDDTMVVYIVGDNGASGEGGLQGTVSEVASVNGIQLGLPGLLAKFDQIGGPETEPHVPAAWAWAADTPFKWTKQVASHFGGTRNPVVIRWPKGLAARGELRSQFHHVIDIAPTVLEAAHLPAPRTVNGVAQKPIEGVSMLYSFADRDTRSRRSVQYFEMMGNRAIYKDGWIASARHGRLPWQTAGAATGAFADDQWELYDLSTDFSQANDLAARYPDKVKEMQAAFMEEARKYNVLPLDDRLSERFDMSLRPNPLKGLTKMIYGPGVGGLNESATLNTHGVPFSITADVEIGPAGGDGVLAAMGGTTCGWTLYVKDGRPTFAYNFFAVEETTVASGAPLAPGKASIRVDVTPVAPSPGAAADVTLWVDGKQVASGRVPRTAPFRYSTEPFDVGRDSVSAVSNAYRSPFAFQGRIAQVAVEVR
ncbi:sulfatase-like hydrolase/transferase [Alsobacter sp. SYSU M60028]|uniref:Sulfatase-like hydrolase/transferase n=1 Tax=Alsobacter ponti TaxID=2962936 RepID=A0ABT1LIQ7_9HYPH|nr:arylsulfatase [Alsobacter ponti]MCP8941006.1 sulfatase-like hydrolase/transferase [Alsobacter ponti]